MDSDDGVQHSELLSFWTLSIVQYSKKLENTTFWKLDLFPSSGRGGRTPSQLGPLERANLNHWNTGRWTKSKNLVILSVIHHRQNPLESTC
jgi:hypothetical protein